MKLGLGILRGFEDFRGCSWPTIKDCFSFCEDLFAKGSSCSSQR